MKTELTQQIIGAAIDVHRELGPGLLESAYEECLAYELGLHHLPFERQKAVTVFYKSVKVDCGFRVDFLVGSQVVVELKAVDALVPVHHAQVLTYLKLTGCPIGLLINFNTTQLTKGIKRLILSS